jgi:hypothetical protein
VLADLLVGVGLAALLADRLDSVEPRCTSHTVPRMKSVNCRYSDCQFSMTSTAYADDVT